MNLHRQPAAGGLGDFRGFEAEEAGYGGAGEVDVEDADGVAGEGEGEGELGGYGGFADAAFAGEDLGWWLVRVWGTAGGVDGGRWALTSTTLRTFSRGISA